MCHGPQGRGDGPMAASLNPRPMDFTDASKRLATTDSAVAAVIRRGRRAMPSFAQVLSASQVDSVVAFIKTLHR
jgi:high-affinity iron transporter